MDFDIIVSGAGLSGLIAASLFSKDGLRVALIDPQAPISDDKNNKVDLRSTAFLQPAQQVLKQAGAWESLEEFATPLETMRLANACPHKGEITHLADFNASEISDLPFAWNLPNSLLRTKLIKLLEQRDNISLFFGQRPIALHNREAEIRVKLNDNTLNARLLIAADGRNSFIREELGIGCKTWRYGQRALAFIVTHEETHQNISTEIHQTGGPFTTVPLPQKDKQNFSAIIWMETAQNADELMKMAEPEFNKALMARSCGILGDMALYSGRSIWPIITQAAESITAQRTALIAEAAHVIPPIGAQGLNMSLADIDCLESLSHEFELGSVEHLAAYEKARLPDIKLRIRGVDALNRAAMAESAQLRALRLKGLQTLHWFAPLRKSLMRKGLGA